MWKRSGCGSRSCLNSQQHKTRRCGYGPNSSAVDADRWARRHVNNPRTAELFEHAAAAAADLAAAAAADDSDGSSAAVTQLYNIGDRLTVHHADAGTGAPSR